MATIRTFHASKPRFPAAPAPDRQQGYLASSCNKGCRFRRRRGGRVVRRGARQVRDRAFDHRRFRCCLRDEHQPADTGFFPINRQIQNRRAGPPSSRDQSNAEILELQKIYDQDFSEEFDLGGYDYVIDAIDSLTNKVELIRRASLAGAKVYTALGASGKLDPSRIKTASLWDSHDCPLGKFVRKKLRQRGFNRDSGEVTCVFSDEEMAVARDEETVCGTGACHCPKSIAGEVGEDTHEWCSSKKQINGSAVHITGTMGFMLAGLVIQDVVKRANS